MQSKQWSLTVGIALLLITAAACSFNISTANISSFKLGTDKAVTKETTTFNSTDTVYGVAEVSNAPSKVKVVGHFIIEDAEGEKSGPVPSLDTTVELPGSGKATFTYTPPPSGWPKGKYKLEVLMLNENGEQKDQKTVSFTVS
jgi:hypothetical protein